MNNQRQTDQERTKALASLIHQHENKSGACADDYLERAQDALRSHDSPSISPLSRVADENPRERATLKADGHSSIEGTAMIHREQPEEGGRFYPSNEKDLNVSLNLPATLQLQDTGETFDLVRLLPGHPDASCYEIGFSE